MYEPDPYGRRNLGSGPTFERKRKQGIDNRKLNMDPAAVKRRKKRRRKRIIIAMALRTLVALVSLTVLFTVGALGFRLVRGLMKKLPKDTRVSSTKIKESGEAPDNEGKHATETKDLTQILAEKFKLPEIPQVVLPFTNPEPQEAQTPLEEPQEEFFDQSFVDPLDGLSPQLLDNPLELPVVGATGYASVEIPVYGGNANPDQIEQVEAVLDSLYTEKKALEDQLSGIMANVMMQQMQTPEMTQLIEQTNQKLLEYDLQIQVFERERDNMGGREGSLSPGECFRIMGENGSYWSIKREDGSTGWVPYERCMINLPDVIPSIVYNITNASSSVFRTVGKEMPGITGQKLFDARDHNERLNEDEYVVPVLYVMSKKIANAQRIARQNGDTLVIYEGFRPYQVQMKVGNVLQQMADSDSEVKAGISTSPWTIRWFIARSLSNHQRGCAIDVSIARIRESKEYTMGDYTYSRIQSYDEYTMYTPMHELSTRAVLFTRPVSSKSPTEWKSAAYAPGVNNAVRRLQNYCTATGLTPLASEWWHFNDLEGEDISAKSGANGNYFMTKTMSRPLD